MGKDERRYATVVLDANVVIAALIREQGVQPLHSLPGPDP